MAQAVFAFLMSIIISLGGSVTADNIGQDFATIYSNQDPSVQKKMDLYLFDPGGQLMRDISLEGIKLTTEMLYDIQGGKVSNEIIQESIGIDAWKDFVNSNQDKVDLNTDKSKFNCGDYSFKFGAGIEPIGGTGCQSFAYVDIYYKGELSTTLRNYFYTANYLDYETSYADALPWYNTLCSNMYFDKDTNSVLCFGKPRGEFCFDLSEYISGDVDAADTPSDIGEAGEYPINADGSITLPDGTVITPNADGTYTIGGTTYYPSYNLPAYNDSALLELLRQLLQKISDLENKLEFETDTTDEELDDKLDEAATEVQSYSGTLSEFMLDSAITKVFPFCLPFDFVRGIKLFNASPQTPVFIYNLKIPAVGSFAGTQIEIKIDFSKFETLASISRWVSTVGFAFSLIFVSTKIVKGAGA